MLCEVIRTFNGPGSTPIAPGTSVDTATWRPGAVQSLIARRFLRPLDAPVAVADSLKRDRVCALLESGMTEVTDLARQASCSVGYARVIKAAFDEPSVPETQS